MATNETRAGAKAAPADLPATGVLHSIRAYPAFAMLMLGTLATNTGFWMYQTAVGWLALQLTDSALFVGLAGFAGGIPMLVLAIPAGVILDRSDRRTVLKLAQWGVMAVSAAFAILVVTDLIQPWSLLVLAFLYGSVMSFIFPTRTTMVPSLVSRQDMANAVALNSATQNATRVIGPAVAGVLIALLGASGTFAFAAVLQIVALYTTNKLPAVAAGRMNRGGGGRSSLMVGLRTVASSQILTGLVLLSLMTNVLVMPYINLMPVFAENVMDIGSAGLGILLAAIGLGTVGGALYVARSQAILEWRSIQIITAASFGALVVLFALTSHLHLAVGLVILFLGGFASALFLALNQTALQLRVDEDKRGRVFSVYLLTWGLLPLGQLPTGYIAERAGAPLAVVVSSAIALAGIVLVAWRYPSLRE
ncbi:MAG TPA: MFS transporter [Thermomicrobiales bacterium]|nr:MFS transporter [Thermomicrobiales bacterium]